MDGVYLADLESKSAERIVQHESYVSSAVFLPDQNTIVSAGYDGTLKWTERSSRQLVRSLDLHRFWSWDMAVSPDGGLIA